jgi:predicted AlkP superfamily pyrophosphatase or phosphodiesterase
VIQTRPAGPFCLVRGRTLLLCSVILLGIVLPATAKTASTVMLISIDGLKPEAVFDAQKHGLKLPNLVRLAADGIYSKGVRGVLPTLTYPSHTTLLTGASPTTHGIYANTTFDPFNRNYQGWYWYAEDIKVPTLWDAAHTASPPRMSIGRLALALILITTCRRSGGPARQTI